MLHSIIIPCSASRLPHLRACLESLERSMEVTGIRDCECVPAIPWPHDPPFNKSKALNRGIEVARGDVLTFLDADAIVGPFWLEGVRDCDWSKVTRLCYRVRYLDQERSQRVLAGHQIVRGRTFPGSFVGADGKMIYTHEADVLAVGENHPFTDIDALKLGYEAYGDPLTNGFRPGAIWGNSQFSMTREALGDLRFDGAYAGRGFEDVAFLRQVQKKFGASYVGQIMTDPAHALLHLTHDYEPEWRSNEITQRNLAHFKATQ